MQECGGPALTLGPYGDGLLSSLFCRTLWKSYLFSCRTKLAKLLCLKCFGRISLVNFSFCPSCQYLVAGCGASLALRTSKTTKLSPPSPQRTMLSYDGSSNILQTKFVSQHAQSCDPLQSRLTCIICAPGHRSVMSDSMDCAGQLAESHSQSRWNCWRQSRPCPRLCPWCAEGAVPVRSSGRRMVRWN
jgi:hypothetical protein